jgi:hypothetical protein
MGAIPVAPPNRQRAPGFDFFNDTLCEQLGDDLAGGAPGSDLSAVQGRGHRAAMQPTAAPVGYRSISRNSPSVETALAAATTEAPQWR